jgi:hypothetical protein
MNVLARALRVLVTEGPAGVASRIWLRLRPLLMRCAPIRRWVARRRWERAERVILARGGPDVRREWGEARRRIYVQWGPFPCARSDRRRLRALKDAHRGERIFIMGNGPSLNRTPLEKLAGEYTFGLNRVSLLFDRISWKPSFLTLSDWFVGPDCADELNALEGMKLFFPERFRGLLRSGPDVYWYWIRELNREADAPIAERFSYDAARGVRPGFTVTAVAVQLAFHMGFDPIYLIGCDCDYKVLPTVKQSGPDRYGDGVLDHLESTRDDDPNHFDPRYFGKGYRWHNPAVPMMLWGFGNCREAVEAAGRRIYNATVGGKLEVFERVDFDSLF